MNKEELNNLIDRTDPCKDCRKKDYCARFCGNKKRWQKDITTLAIASSPMGALALSLMNENYLK